MTTKLYRAADYAEVRVGYSLTPQKKTAQAYLENPGFGGQSLHVTSVELDGVLDLYDSEDEWADLSAAAGITIDPEAYQHHFARVLPTSDTVCESLAACGYHWVRIRDDFPAGAVTMIPVSESAADAADAEIEEI